MNLEATKKKTKGCDLQPHSILSPYLAPNPPPKNGGVFLPFLPSLLKIPHNDVIKWPFSLTYVHHFFDFFSPTKSRRLPQ